MRIPIPTVVIPVGVALLYFFVPGIRESAWTPLRIVGAVIAVGAFVFAAVARGQLGKSFSVQPRARELVTHGLYSRLRNPIYVFVDIMLAGIILALRLYWLFLLVPVLIAVQTVQARREARVLRNAYGQRYDDYAKRTWF